MSVRAFSLLEVLAVMAIIGLVVALAVPAVGAIKGSNDLTSNAFRLAETLEQARTYAMANNTYVLVGLEPVSVGSGPNAGLTDRLGVSVVATRDGSRGYAPGNLNQVSRLVQLENIRFADAVNPDPTRPADDIKSASTSGIFSYPLTGSGKYVFDRAVEFTPQGMARLYAGTPTLPRGGLLLRVEAAKGGGATAASANYAQLQIDSLTGSVRISRP